MQPPDYRSDTTRVNSPRNTEEALQALTHEIESLRQDISVQLDRDVRWLQGEKGRLMQEIDQLRRQHQTLQNTYQTTLSQQQVAQQQLWAKQLAHALATQFQEQLMARLNGGAIASPNRSPNPPNLDGYSDNLQRLLVSLDSTMNQTFATLQQDLNSYQSTLSQQLNRMYSIESQGEVILETLVNRLIERLQESDSVRTSVPRTPPPGKLPQVSLEEEQPQPVVLAPPPPPPKPQAPAAVQWRTGIIFALLASFAFSLQNVVTRIILLPSTLFGLVDIGGIVAPSLGNSIFILWLRMLVVVPLVSLLGTNGYQLDNQPFWLDIQKFFASRDLKLKLIVLASGFFLFASQTLAYIAFGNMAAGVVTTLILTYPIITIFLASVLFNDRLTPFRIIASMVVFFGIVLIAVPFGAEINFSTVGVLTGLGSGVALAICVIFSQMAFRQINPIPFTLVQFGVIFVFSSVFSAIGAIVNPNFIEIPPGTFSALLLAGIILGITTLTSYLFQNLGIRFAGAASYSIVANTGPVMTSILAFLMIGEVLTFVQLLGMLIVTAGVIALGVKRLQDETKGAKAS
ncbi:MAG: EamA family transporter [Spirulinaceae cyanobacterium]